MITMACTTCTRDNKIRRLCAGTKWCGTGTISTDYEDLGKYREEDKCCRAHDNCNILLKAGESNYNLTNTSKYTKLHCKCDEAFMTCLRQLNTLTSNTLGDFYFNLVRNRCFDLEYPIRGCLRWES
ncbi:hypothetical protein LAZ67_6003905 [Cordylochernes scorpioides]|uniref:Phospholipase A2-like central domain-containing protein n=1 Tax=Cordylochernes scorpioides TaxID=51811 RepID=A0ABY6KNW6_9ARAC|nr:hypothetical protein LAZ67_6003905 [Cordylochernes scorpioides]